MSDSPSATTGTTTGATHAATQAATPAPGASPHFTAFHAPSSVTCPQSGGGPYYTSTAGSVIVHLSWTATNANDVSLAIDNPGGIYQDHLPSAGSIDVYYPCDHTAHTYYIVATSKGGATANETATVTGEYTT